MSNLQTPTRHDPDRMPTLALDDVADSAIVSPPNLQVPAFAAPALPSLPSIAVLPPTPIVPPTPAPTSPPPPPALPTAPAEASAVVSAPLDPHVAEEARCPQIVESTPSAGVSSLSGLSAPPASAPDSPPVAFAPPAPPAPPASPAPEAAVPPLPGLAPTPTPTPTPAPAPAPTLTPAPTPTLAPAAPAPAVVPAVQADAGSAVAEPLSAQTVSQPQFQPEAQAQPHPQPQPQPQPQMAAAIPAMPSLPSVGAVAAAAPKASHQPIQAGSSPIVAQPLKAASAPKSQGALGRAVGRTLGAIVLAGIVGVGAHLGYDWWQSGGLGSEDSVVADGTKLASWPEVAPPAIRYTDSITTFANAEGTRTVTAHREISTGFTQADILATDAAASIITQASVDIRGAEAFVQPTPEAAWTPADPADAAALLGDTWTTDVFTVRDLFPTAAVPYITVLESVERVLPVRPLQPDANPGGVSVAPIAISTDPTSMVWQYRVIIDLEAFRLNETVAFQDWERRMGRNAVPRIEAWIDATGIVRKIAVDVDGTKVTQTLTGGVATSTRFQTSPLDAEPAPATAPATAPVEPISAEEGE